MIRTWWQQFISRWFWLPKLYSLPSDDTSKGRTYYVRTGNFHDVSYETPPAVRYYEYRRVKRLVRSLWWSSHDPFFDCEYEMRPVLPD